MKKLSLAIACTTIVFAGCAAPESGSETAKTETVPSKPAEASSVVPVAHKNAEGKLVCPVMNVVIESEKAAVDFADHDGKRYFFCCDGCPQKFRADPAKYASK